jgi:hypothetical protein
MTRAKKVDQARPKSNRPILVIGNSHTVAIAAALDEATADLVDVVNLKSHQGGRTESNKRLRPALAKEFAPKRIFCTFGGSEHNVIGLIEAPTRFDFEFGSIADLDPDRWAVPLSVMKATLHERMSIWLGLATELKRMFDVPIMHLCSPPPFLHLDGDSALPTAFRDKAHLGITPPSIRMKLHALLTEIAQEHMKSAGIGFLPVPAKSVDEAGYLRREFWTRDPTHGNESYGGLVLEQILGVRP